VTVENGSVRVEILAREDCPNREMALIVVERVVDETGIPAEIEVVEMADDDDAEEHRVLGRPTTGDHECPRLRVAGRRGPPGRLEQRGELGLGHHVLRVEPGRAPPAGQQRVQRHPRLVHATTLPPGDRVMAAVPDGSSV